MTPSRIFPALFAMLLAAGSAAAQSDWASYRDTYRRMVVFEKYGKPKHLLQQHLQAAPRGQLVLESGSSRVALPLDATGRTPFPWSKAAYDANAALVLAGAGPLVLRPRVSIAPRTDGLYELDELRAACAQALGFQRHVDAGYGARQCAGVRFSFAPDSGKFPARLRSGAGESGLPAADGAAFAGDAGTGFSVIDLRFDGAGKGQVLTPAAPLAITPIFE
jgi:hypothetical protein